MPRWRIEIWLTGNAAPRPCCRIRFRTLMLQAYRSPVNAMASALPSRSHTGYRSSDFLPLQFHYPLRHKHMTSPLNDSGSATVEFIGLTVLLLIPAMYILITISQLQAAGYATVAASDQAAKTIGHSFGEGDAEARAIKTVHLTAENYQLDPTITTTTIDCSNPVCTTPGTRITVNVSIDVPLPLVPTFFGAPTRIATMDATGHHVIGEFE